MKAMARPAAAPTETPLVGRSMLLLATVAASSIFVLTTFAVRGSDPPQWELSLFRTINDLPDWLYVVIWPFMQYGVFVTIPIVSAYAWWRRRRRLAGLLLVSGVSIYLLAKVVKQVANRGRPDAFFDLVNEREEFAVGSLGYTSGHAAVAATIATLTLIHLGRPWRAVSIVLLSMVMVGRIYVGAHLALDMVGGVAMGVAAGAGSTLIVRMLERSRTDSRIQEDAPWS